MLLGKGSGPKKLNEVLIWSEVVGVAKVANNWASEASPTLGCPIEISRDYIWRASEARETLSEVCSIENRGYILYIRLNNRVSV